MLSSTMTVCVIKMNLSSSALEYWKELQNLSYLLKMEMRCLVCKQRFTFFFIVLTFTSNFFHFLTTFTFASSSLSLSLSLSLALSLSLLAWKLMKIAADEKTRKGLMQQALHEYGQLLKHPYMFGIYFSFS